MYWHMDKKSENLKVDRGMALHKMIRLITLATSGGGYLNFMGNEFGHPEWIDFPREGNNWSFKYARRQWSLSKDKKLRYHYLSDFDKAMLEVCRKERILMHQSCNFIHNHETDQVLAFSRGDLYFVFNFNPVQSFTDYGFNVPSGEYKMVLNTDNPRFGGFGNVEESIVHFAQPFIENKNKLFQLKLYIPGRTGMVLKRLAK